MRIIIFISFFSFYFFSLTSFSQSDDNIGNHKKSDSIKVKQKNEPLILTNVEKMPSFPDGENAMYKFLSENIKYPEYARDHNITGTVIITYVVEKDGSISGITILKDIGGGCGEEGVRVIKSMPKWICGKLNGIPVRVQYNLPIQFPLSEGHKKKKR